MTTVCVFGGTGFLGRRVVRRLATDGASVRIAVRSAQRAHSVLGAAELDRVSCVRADVRDPASIAAALAGVDAVVNAVSAYVERPGITFESVHVQGAKSIAEEAAAGGVDRLVLVSGIGADAESRSPYIRARGRGEHRVSEAFARATIVRPGAMFGPGDALFGTLARISRVLPAVPLIGGGATRLQPVYVEDIAEAIVRMLGDAVTAGKTYELGGPRVYSLRALFEFALHLMGRRRPLVPLPFTLAEIQARLFELLPNPPLTTSQVDLLREDNVASGALPGFADLGIHPRTVEEIVPTYIGRNSGPAPN